MPEQNRRRSSTRTDTAGSNPPFQFTSILEKRVRVRKNDSHPFSHIIFSNPTFITMTTIDTTSVARMGAQASITAGVFTLVFGFFIFAGSPSVYLEYAVCMVLSIAYLLTSLANTYVVKNNPKTPVRKHLFADAATLFGVVYCVCTSIVYYVQITFVRLGKPSADVLTIIRFQPPSAFFAIEQLGYGFLTLSTLFLSFSIKEGGGGEDEALANLLLFHFFVGIVGFVMPALPFVYEDTTTEEDWIYVFVLLGWCIIFVPICFLLALRFLRLAKSVGSRTTTTPQNNKIT